MKSGTLAGIWRLLAAAKTAEASKLARAMAEIAACRDRAALLRCEISQCCAGLAPGGGGLAAGDILAASRWVSQLADRAAAEDARAAALEAGAEVIRQRLARAFGRESAAAAMLDKARVDERRMLAHRVEAAIVARRIACDRAPDQPFGSDSGSAGTSAGSAGIA